MKSKLSKWSVALAALALAIGGSVTALEGKGNQDSEGFIAHEWGTFTTISAGDAKVIAWQSQNGTGDLPSFVYSTGVQRNTGLAFKARAVSRVRMETPVVYFYTDKPQTVSVTATLPQGRMTEWYPRATFTGKSLTWPKVELLPGDTTEFPSEKGDDHYSASRETDSVPLRVGKEHEKLLFYRGTGNFALPISVTLQNDLVTITAAKGQQLGTVIAFDNTDGVIKYQAVSLDKGTATLSRFGMPVQTAAPEAELKKLLVADGLYEKEAAAMLKTWKDSWYEPGFRVFYLMPRAETDKVLTLDISPKPKELVRSMVGRFDVMTPLQLTRMRKLIEATALSQINPAFGAYGRAQFGRFAVPISQALAAQYERGSVEQRKAYLATQQILMGVPAKKYQAIPATKAAPKPAAPLAKLARTEKRRMRFE
jgi:hypothetical protein